MKDYFNKEIENIKKIRKEREKGIIVIKTPTDTIQQEVNKELTDIISRLDELVQKGLILDIKMIKPIKE